jgi:hypothetical protein
VNRRNPVGPADPRRLTLPEILEYALKTLPAESLTRQEDNIFRVAFYLGATALLGQLDLITEAHDVTTAAGLAASQRDYERLRAPVVEFASATLEAFKRGARP